MSIGYRKDIDGLRAVAVVPVVLYHAGISLLGGGFVGVDVFFVISGYLITSILANDIETDRFSIVSFYERRARRIFPALFTMMLISSIVFTIIMLSSDLLAFAKSIIAAVSFTSNILFYREFGYFAVSSAFKPLLHTWSLAVEEQFYILFPILLYVLSKAGRWKRNATLTAIVGLSLAINVWGIAYHPNATFYLLPARAWELLLGSLLALNVIPAPATRGLREIAAALGLALIAYSVLTLTSADPFPGWNAAPPCIGAALIIWAGAGGKSLGGRLLGLRPVVFIGKISYSLYLWHWPIIVFVKYSTSRELSEGETGLVITLSLAAAVLSWRYIEQPFRGRGSPFSRRWIFSCSAAATALLLSIGAATYVAKGWPQRFPEAIPIIEKYAAYKPGGELLRSRTCFLHEDQSFAEYPVDTCYGGEAPDILIWGDSQAAQLYRGLSVKAADAALSVGQATYAACLPVLGLDHNTYPGCAEFNDRTVDLIRSRPPKTVVLGGRWETLQDQRDVSKLEDTIAALRKIGAAVLVVGQSPSFFAPAYALYIRGMRSGSTDAPVAGNDHTEINRWIADAADRGGASFFAPDSLFCNGTMCRIQTDGTLLFWDRLHLTIEGSEYVGAKLFEQYGAELSLQARAKL
ncbi:acyltransferase [Inquilinus limosus]|uniref:acyltransferase family protein n=1 Tax=Inquilinus limosus TaxID=171674 RepID=UPI003F140B78